MSVGGLEGSGSALLSDLGSSLESHAASNAAAPLSDDDFRRLFHSDSSVEPDSSLVEDGLSFDILNGGDLSAFPFDSLVDFDPEPVALDGVDSSIGLPDEASHQATGVQPSLGASTSRCDGQSIAASG